MIKNIIFDLGGVIYDIRYQNIADKFREYADLDFNAVYGKYNQTDFIDLFETGYISPEMFRNKIREILKINLTDSQIDDAWNAILVDVPEKRVALLKKLKQKYSLFLFSNTNQINYDYFVPYLNNKYGCNFFDVFFTKAYFSQLMHYRKPAQEGFYHILNEQHINADETLFVDDIEKNVSAAQSIGIQGFHLQDGMDVADIDFDALCG